MSSGRRRTQWHLGRFRLTRIERRNLRWGLLFISPWLIGFVGLTLAPFIYTLLLSLTRYSGIRPPVFIGLRNYARLFADPDILKSIYNTLYYTVLAVPLGVVVAMTLGLAMNRRLREIALYRAVYYIPSLLPISVAALVFIVMLNPEYGLMNAFLQAIGLPGPNWFGDPSYTKLGLVLLAQLGAGQWGLVFLAGLQAIPRDLYETAQIDGAGALAQFRCITMPLMTPVIFYDLIIGLSSGLQVFSSAYIITRGGAHGAGPDNSLLFYVYYLYKNAFQFGQVGYAAAMSVGLFVVSVFLSAAVFRWARGWVFYQAEDG